jgi:DNA invertase Pin-like site-specific DNA recombinase
MTVHAYYRISKDTSDLENQRREVRAASVQRFGRTPDVEVEEIVTGKKKAAERDLEKLLRGCKFNDVLICASTTRIGRNFYDTIDTARFLQERGVTFIALQQNFTMKPDDDTMSKFFLSAYAFFGENERKEISVRTKAALATRTANGLKNGRAFGSFKEPTEKQLKELGKYLDAGRYYKAEMCKITGLAKPTFDRWLKKYPDYEKRRVDNREKVSPFYTQKVKYTEGA